MRKVIALFCALMLLAAWACAEEDLAQKFKEKYEESVAFKAIRTLSRYASDDLTLDQSVMSIREKTVAWDYMKYLEDGFFSSTKMRTYTDYSSDNWVALSETEFCCDVYCNLTIRFSTNNAEVTFPCAYHFCFRQMNKQKDFWQAYDFYTLPCAKDEETAERVTAEYDGISLYTVNGKTYKGFMMVVDDPSRLFVGTIDRFGSSVTGMRINELMNKYSGIAIGAINGGGFADTKGSGKGGEPYGLVVSEGNLLRGHQTKGDICNVIMGFDENDKLIVGKYTYNESLNLGLRDAMAFHPALIVDGQPAKHTERRMYTIRTAIGQDKDGHVLLLVIKGRQPDSLGASIEDLQEIMLSYGAVTAGNLDGGSSTCMYLDDESIYSGYWPDVSRRIPAAFMIRSE